jgi:HAD superfamily hydrolase (TIGR01549 family)
MPRNIHAVLFDLGNTLMYSHAPWPPIFLQAGKAMGEYLRSRKINVDSSSFSDEFRQRLNKYYIEREHSMIETSSLGVLKDMLAEKGHANLPQELLRAALDHYYAITQQNWLLENDAVPTLVKLRSEAFHVGLVSNASDSRDVLTLVDKFGIREYFDFILVSADCGYRKPHPRIFELALANWGYLPDEIVMVGDKLDADIGGARPLGIYTIWIKRRAKDVDLPPASPNATVQTLSEIPPLLLNQFK